jgi:hypothetical protein
VGSLARYLITGEHGSEGTAGPGRAWLQPCRKFVESFRALAPEGIFYQRAREFRGCKKHTSAAKADYGIVIYGTAEAVPFQDRVPTQNLKPGRVKNHPGATTRQRF